MISFMRRLLVYLTCGSWVCAVEGHDWLLHDMRTAEVRVVFDAPLSSLELPKSFKQCVLCGKRVSLTGGH